MHNAAASIAGKIREKTRKDAFECASYQPSKEMCKFIPAIRRLGYMNGGLGDAFHLVVILGVYSFLKEPSMSGGYNLREWDNLADALLVELAEKAKQEIPNFNFSSQFKVIREESAWLTARGVPTFFPRELTLLSSWEPNAKAREKEEKAQEMKLSPEFREARGAAYTIEHQMTIYARDTTRKLVKMVATGRHAGADWISQEICKFIPEIEEISEMPQGLMPALGLTFLLGKLSYTTLADVRPNFAFPRMLGPNRKQRFDRPSDPLVDDLLCKLLKKAPGTSKWSGVSYEKEVTSVRTQRAYLADFGITGYFAKSVEVLSGLVA